MFVQSLHSEANVWKVAVVASEVASDQTLSEASLGSAAGLVDKKASWVLSAPTVKALDVPKTKIIKLRLNMNSARLPKLGVKNLERAASRNLVIVGLLLELCPFPHFFPFPLILGFNFPIIYFENNVGIVGLS